MIAYCRIGERSSHTWFVLTHLLGFEGVRNYDGSWTEWGSAVRVPIVKGAEPGAVSRALYERVGGVSDRRCPSELAEIRDDFLALEQRERLQLLLEFSKELPELPERYADHPDLLERVEECQSPVFIFVEVEDDADRAPARDGAEGGADHPRVRVDPRAGSRGADGRAGARRARPTTR